MSAPLPRLAVFDVDGTLVDSQHNIIAAMSEAFETHGHPPPPPADVRRIIGLSLVEAVAALLPGADPAHHGRVAETYGAMFAILRRRPDHSEPLFPGAVECLTALGAAGFQLGIATGKSRRGLQALLDRTGLGERFTTLHTADDGPGKPHPAMLAAAMADTGIPADRTVMIGDTSFDMLMARAAGTAGIGVAWGYHGVGDLEDAGAHQVVATFADLPAAVARLTGG
ncbi:MAG: HAD-IA family hydrolase [Alphaproteobacteria bacterium]